MVIDNLTYRDAVILHIDRLPKNSINRLFMCHKVKRDIDTSQKQTMKFCDTLKVHFACAIMPLKKYAFWCIEGQL